MPPQGITKPTPSGEIQKAYFVVALIPSDWVLV